MKEDFKKRLCELLDFSCQDKCQLKDNPFSSCIVTKKEIPLFVLMRAMWRLEGKNSIEETKKIEQKLIKKLEG